MNKYKHAQFSIIHIVITIVHITIHTIVSIEELNCFTYSQVGSNANNDPLSDNISSQQPQLINYSSLGPAYETMEANKGAGHTYDVINRNQQNVNQGRQDVQQQNNFTEPTAADLTCHHDYHVLEPTNENKQENNYHVLEQSSQVPNNVEEHDYHVLESNSPAAVRESGREGAQQASQVQRGGDGIDPDPQDYEIPTPTMKPRGADEDDEEYSRLKH